MAFEREQHAVGHPQGAENSPPREQTDLAGSEGQIGSFANAVIVKNKTVKHHTILSRGVKTKARSQPCGCLYDLGEIRSRQPLLHGRASVMYLQTRGNPKQSRDRERADAVPQPRNPRNG